MNKKAAYRPDELIFLMAGGGFFFFFFFFIKSDCY